MSVKEQVCQILQSEFGLDLQSLGDDDSIFADGLLDSLSSLKLLLALEKTFGISISPLDVSLDDVDSVALITATVERLQNA